LGAKVIKPERRLAGRARGRRSHNDVDKKRTQSAEPIDQRQRGAVLDHVKGSRLRRRFAPLT
jgi:hypothetical protein